jgi:hypothetical protein
MATFDRAAAKAAGYTDAEIDAYIAAEAPAKRAALPAVQRQAAESTAAPNVQTERQRKVQQLVRSQERREAMRGAAEAIPAAIANVSRDIPGAEAAQAFARSLVRRQPYAEALQDIRGATASLPASVRVPTRLAGGMLATAAAPGSTLARQGAAYGAAMGLTEASPEVGVAERVTRGAGQAAFGAAVGKATDVLGTVGRARATPTAESTLLRQEARRAAEAGPKYETFRKMGDLAENISTPEQMERTVTILELPVVRRAINLVKEESPRLSKLADTDAQVLDAVYKRIGNRSFRSQMGYETGEAADELLAVMDDLSGGAYSPAVGAYRRGSQEIAATERGAGMISAGPRPSRATLESAVEQSVEGMPKWLERASPEERLAALRGVLGELRQFGVYDVLSPVGAGFRGGPSLVPGARRAIRASELVNMLEGRRLGPQTALRGAVARPIISESARLAPIAQLMPGGRK